MNTELVSSHILVVDDVPANLQVVSAILSSQGYTVHTVRSGQEALDYLSTVNVDLILLDVMMPGMNGFETTRQIKSNPAWERVPVIFLTALTDKDEVVQGFESGGVDYVTKPFNKSELLIRVKTHLTLEKTRYDLEEKNTVLNRTALELKEANVARDKFLSILAHDLKNPFAGLLSLMDEILKDLDSFEKNEMREIFQTLRNSSNNVYHLLLTLLDWGRSQTGGLVLNPQFLNLNALVDDILFTFENSLNQKQLELHYLIDIPEIKADRETLATVLRNLVSNAIKYSKPGGKILFSSTRESERICLSVQDTGIGIKPENLKRLFRLDSKLSTLGTNHEVGTGLGLILCKEFVERNGGTLTVESQWGLGTIFRIYFPLDLGRLS